MPLKTSFTAHPHIVEDRLQYEVRNYPNPDKAAYVIQGLHHGFHLGLQSQCSLKVSVRQHGFSSRKPPGHRQILAY